MFGSSKLDVLSMVCRDACLEVVTSPICLRLVCESAMINNLGFEIDTDSNFRKDAYLFGESQSRVVISVSKDKEDQLVNLLNSNNVSFSKIGQVTGGSVSIDGTAFGQTKDWKTVYDNTLENILEN